MHPRSSSSHLKVNIYTDIRTHAPKVPVISLTTKGAIGDNLRWRRLLKADLSQGDNSLLKTSLISVGLGVSLSMLH